MPIPSDNTADSTVSNVRLRLLDPLGRAIHGLKYEVRQGSKVLADGVTDAEGRVAQFASEIGQTLVVHVEHFASGAMTPIREITPWTEMFSVKLVSGKIKERATLAPDAGSAGGYRRKTYIVKSGDTLGAIARQSGTTANEIAALNHIGKDAIIHPGQLLKLPVPVPSGGGSAAPTSARPPSPAPAPSLSSSAAVAPRAAPSAASAPPAAPVTTQPPARAPVPPSPPPLTASSDDRGENGTPKTTVSVQCSAACLKTGDRGPLIEEINLRLTGFGGTVSSPHGVDEFTSKTESAVRQFQRDYMGIPETGKVCGKVLLAIDEFRARFPIDLASMRCRCGHCEGWGTQQTDSRAAGMFSDAHHTHPYPGTEYPGMHRAVLWGMRAALFYTSAKDRDLGYAFLKVSSGYRCWRDNAIHHRHTTNHMGNALDLQFRKGNSTTRCAGSDIDDLRSRVFVSRLGAQLSWPDRNKLSLETAAQGATSWVHVDVREYETRYKDSRYYAVTQAVADGDTLAEIARREGRLALLACGGLLTTSAPAPEPAVPAAAPPTSPATATRVDISSLSISAAGLEFIQGWEHLDLHPYDDSQGFCTVGYGHLIARQTCASLANDARLTPYKDGIDKPTADRLFAADVRRLEAVVQDSVQVPMFQHEYDALVSLIFNLGGFSKCPRLLSKLNTRDYSGCCDEFADITNHGTPGLVKRRQAEMRIFRNAVYDSTH